MWRLLETTAISFSLTSSISYHLNGPVCLEIKFRTKQIVTYSTNFSYYWLWDDEGMNRNRCLSIPTEKHKYFIIIIISGSKHLSSSFDCLKKELLFPPGSTPRLDIASVIPASQLRGLPLRGRPWWTQLWTTCGSMFLTFSIHCTWLN